MKTESQKNLRSRFAVLMAMMGCVLFAACEDSQHIPQLFCRNDSASRITIVIDGVSLGRLGPREGGPFEITAGEHTVQILREGQTPIFTGSFELGLDQSAVLTVNSDESVTGPLVWNTDLSNLEFNI